MRETISVIIPVYNEQQTIREVISRVLKISGVRQVIVVDDGSTDGTKNILRQSFPGIVQIIRNEVNRGKGWAVCCGLRKISCDLVVIQDADLEYHPCDYQNLLLPIITGQADAVYGNRLKSAHFLNHPVHFIGNKLVTFLLNFLNSYYISDVACGLKMFKRKVIETINLNSEGFEFDIEITVKVLKAGFKIHSVPVTYKPRSYGEGKKFSFSDRFETVKAVFYYSFM